MDTVMTKLADGSAVFAECHLTWLCWLEPGLGWDISWSVGKSLGLWQTTSMKDLFIVDDSNVTDTGLGWNYKTLTELCSPDEAQLFKYCLCTDAQLIKAVNHNAHVHNHLSQWSSPINYSL